MLTASSLSPSTEHLRGKAVLFFNDLSGINQLCPRCSLYICACASETGDLDGAKKQETTERLSHFDLPPGMTSDSDRIRNLVDVGNVQKVIVLLGNQLKSAGTDPKNLQTLQNNVIYAYQSFQQAGYADYASLLHTVFSDHINLSSQKPVEVSLPETSVTLPAPRRGMNRFL